ncbi:MAG: Stk1 family PASTA domain-containing Ser/Thr kinase [Propionibacteriaceae bacterium]|jgi:serine/threonine-protein kinase|nr:Stk1 family PASTA domain-containing Ser/Thr kinase [Propionibacteriaceae bacterium]
MDTTTATSDRLVGAVLGERYELVGRVARGGTAVVYRAVDRRLGRTVAVKIIHDNLVGDADYVRRFDREAKAAAILSHPNIVAVFDQGHADDRSYIVMEYVRGQSLRSIIAQSAPLPPLVALNHVDAIARALAAAHEAGLVHRDIKPENVLITNTGQVKVTDFGLAKATSAQSSASQSVLMGTLSYLAPELMTDGTATFASDIYSTGIVLYELLTGQKPHTGDEPASVLYKHVHVDVPPPSLALPSPLRERVPDYLDALVQACTSRRPEARPATGRALEQAVAKVRHRLAQGVRQDPALARALRGGQSGDPTTTIIVDGQLSGAQLAGWNLPQSTAGPDPAESGERTPVLRSDLPAPAVRRAVAGPPAKPLRRISRPPLQVRRRRGLIALSVLLLLGLIGGGSAFWWVRWGRWTTTPVVAGLPESQARAALDQAELKIDLRQEYDEVVPLGSVTRSDPADQQPILRSGTVTLYVSLGPERYKMPTLAELPRDEAVELILSSHLAVGQETEVWDEQVPVGHVVRASQEAGVDLRPDTVIDLEISKGRQPIEIPSFVGQTREAAEAGLGQAGFQITLSEEHSPDVPAGSIVQQSPDQGSGYRGDVIALVVSLGPVMIQVPDVRFMTLSDATAKLKGAGFEVKVEYLISSALSLGLASRTDPAIGEWAPQGSTVILKMA